MGKVISQDDLILRRRDWKHNGQRVVFVSGCFDLLHPGHTRILEQARSQGDLLVVAVESDTSVGDRTALLMGAGGERGTLPSRPITPAVERAETLAALAAVDYVIEFDEAALSKLLVRFSPDIFVKGGVAIPDQPDSGLEDKLASGGRIVFVPLEPGYSTSGLIERMTQLRE